MKNFCFALAIVSACLASAQSASAQSTVTDIIGELQADFTAGTPSNGWEYLWNPNGVAIGDSANYAVLGVAGPGYIDNSSTDAVGEGGGTGNFVSFDGTNGDIDHIISGRSANNSADGLDHYAIARYTIQAGEAGDVTFEGDWNLQPAGGTISVFLNDVLTDSFTGTRANTLNLNVGTVAVGDTVDIAFLTPDSAGGSRNSRRFFHVDGNASVLNRTVVGVPEPSSLAVLGLGVLGLVTRRRR